MKNPLSLEIIFFILTCLFVFFIFPFILLAQTSSSFVSTNPPCEPEVIPAFGQTSATFCSYCPNKGDYLHLKWDLQADFKNPVCAVSCSQQVNDSRNTVPCRDWASSLFDDKGKTKSNFKPKDDVFIKNPPYNLNNADQTFYYQVSCFEKNNPSKTKASTGIRVMGECGESVACVERRFSDIVADLDAYQPTVITEKNLREWSNHDALDRAGKGGSGDVVDVMKHVIKKQCSPISDINDVFFAQDGGVQNANKILDSLKNATAKRNAIPLFMVVLRKEKGIATSTYEVSGYHVNIALGITSHTVNYNEFDLKVLDSNHLAGQSQYGHISTLSCKASLERVSFVTGDDGHGLYFKTTPFYVLKKFYRCPYTRSSNPADNTNVDNFEYSVVLFNYKSIDVAKMANWAVRQNTADYLDNDANSLTFDNFITIETGDLSEFDSWGGVCAGWSEFTLLTAYLGKFQDIDCHPNGTFSQIQEKNFLAQVIEPFQKVFEMLGFTAIDKN